VRLIVRILRKFRLLKYFNLTIRTVVNKKVFKIPIIGGMGLSNFEISEPWMTKMLEVISSINSNGAYIDVGVNIGQTLIKLKSTNPTMQYFGFEPNPTCVFYTKKLIEMNKLEHVTIFPCGIASANSLYELSFFSEYDTDSSASMIDNFRPNQKVYKKEQIPCYNIGQIFSERKMPHISIIKIDVEGGELEVLEGLEKIIENDSPYIQIEILPVYDNNNANRLLRQNKIEALLKKWEYVIFRIHFNKENEFDNIELIDTIGIHSNMQWCEYLLVPKREMQKIQSAF
jgi:FkbM family methyltransferase